EGRLSVFSDLCLFGFFLSLIRSFAVDAVGHFPFAVLSNEDQANALRRKFQTSFGGRGVALDDLIAGIARFVRYLIRRQEFDKRIDLVFFHLFFKQTDRFARVYISQRGFVLSNLCRAIGFQHRRQDRGVVRRLFLRRRGSRQRIRVVRRFVGGVSVRCVRVV